MGIWHDISEHLKTGHPCALISIFDKEGSVPREAGTKMIMRHDGSITGSIGGGQLEWEVLKHAQKRLTGLTTHSMMLCKVSLGPGIGQCCGGAILVGIEAMPPDFLSEAQRYERLEQTAPFQCRVTVKGDGSIERRVLPKIINEPANENKSSKKSLQQNQFVENFGEYRRPIYIFGAGHIGHALMLTLGPLPFSVFWVDTRKNMFPKAAPANYRCMLDGDAASILKNASNDSFILIMTHSHAIDMEILRVALLEDRFGFVGLIGSRTKRARFKKRLLEAGVTEEQFGNLVCPIGIEGIRSKHPAAIAASTTAQLLSRNDELGNEAQPSTGSMNENPSADE